LQNCQSFKSAQPEFVGLLSEELEAVFYAPNDVIFKYGEECIFGESPCYLLLAGQVNIESKLGVRLGAVRAVEVFGESAVPGIMGKRTATVVAWEVGLVYCARIPGSAMAKAFEKFPDQSDRLIELFQSRQEANADIERDRRNWLKEVALPSLMEQPIFELCAPQFLWALATPLHETHYERGKAIVNVGEAAHSMFIILKGEVAVESKTAARISVITAKASFGEVAMLGLLPTRTATLRAVSGDVCVLEVTSLALQHALSTKYAGKTGERFKQYVRARQEQVAFGKPLSCLKISTSPDDVSVSAVGLHTQRVCFKSGHIWQPMPDDAPYGPRFSIVATGRAILEMTQNRRKVMTLPAGCLIMEGVAAEFGASMRAVTTPCEVYQVFMNDFKIATSTVSGTTPWIWRFKVLEKEARREMRARLSNMHGLIEGLAPNQIDEEIHAWKDRRLENIRLAKQRRKGEDAMDDDRLPYLTSIESKASTLDDFTLSQQSTLRSERRSPLGKASSQHQVTFNNGLSAYPCFHLPSIQMESSFSKSESSFSKSGRSLNRSSQSEILLRRIRE